MTSWEAKAARHGARDRLAGPTHCPGDRRTNGAAASVPRLCRRPRSAPRVEGRRDHADLRRAAVSAPARALFRRAAQRTDSRAGGRRRRAHAYSRAPDPAVFADTRTISFTDKHLIGRRLAKISIELGRRIAAGSKPTANCSPTSRPGGARAVAPTCSRYDQAARPSRNWNGADNDWSTGPPTGLQAVMTAITDRSSVPIETRCDVRCSRSSSSREAGARGWRRLNAVVAAPTGRANRSAGARSRREPARSTGRDPQPPGRRFRSAGPPAR